MSGADPSGVVVTLADIYHAQQETTVKLAEISGALALQSQQDRNDKATLADHESRIRRNEAAVTEAKSTYITKAGAIGMVLAVAAVVGAAAAALGLVLH